MNNRIYVTKYTKDSDREYAIADFKRLANSIVHSSKIEISAVILDDNKREEKRVILAIVNDEKEYQKYIEDNNLSVSEVYSIIRKFGGFGHD